jgi:putative tricarboxylic transport membrane protein
MTAQRTDLITGGAIAVIGAVYYIATFSIQETANIVTPRTFPAIVGIALIVLGLFLAGQAVYRARKAALAEAGPARRAGAGTATARAAGRRCGRLGGGVGGLG